MSSHNQLNTTVQNLNYLLNGKFDSLLFDLPKNDDILQRELEKNHSLFDNKLKELQDFSSTNDINFLLQEKISKIENFFANYYKNCNLYDIGSYGQFIQKIFQLCPSNLQTAFFLSDKAARRILKTNPPQGIMNFYGCISLEDLYEQISPLDILTISRYSEIPQWQSAYRQLLTTCDAGDFEERAVSYQIVDYSKYRSVLNNAKQAEKPWRFSHNKITGSVICFTINESDSFKAPFLQSISVFMHYFFETAYAGQYYLHIIKKSPDDLGQSLLGSFTNHDGKFDFFDPNVYSETLYWEKAISLLLENFKFVELDFFANTMNCGGVYTSSAESNIVSLNLVDHIWDANFNNGPFLYHFRQAFWKKLFSKIIGMSDSYFDQEIINNLAMHDIDFTNYIKKNFVK